MRLKNSQHSYFWYAVFTLLAAFALYLSGTNIMHLRPDEVLTYHSVQETLPDTVLFMSSNDNHALLWWINIHVWMQMTGISEFAGRMNSIFFSMLTLAVIYRIAKTWSGQAHAGLLALLLMIPGAFFFAFGMDIRPYALAILTSTLSMSAFEGWLRRQNSRSAILYGVSVALMLYTHYYMVFLAAMQGFYFIVFYLRSFRIFRQALVAFFTALLVWLPGLLVFYGQLLWLRFFERFGQGQGGLTTPTRPTDLETIRTLLDTLSNGVYPLYILLLLAGILLIRRRKTWALALGWALGAAALVFFVNIRFPFYAQRYVVYMIGGMAVSVAMVLSMLPRRPTLLATAIVALIMLVQLPNYIPLPPFTFIRPPLRDIYQDVNALAQADDAVVVKHGGNPFFDDVMAQYLAPHLQAAVTEDVEDAQQYRRVWYFTSVWFPESARAAFYEIGETHTLQAAFGDCSNAYCYLAQLLETAPLSTADAIVYAEDVLFRGTTVKGVGDDALEVWLWWQVKEAPEKDYGIGLYLLDEAGQLVAQFDGNVQNYYGEDTPLTALEPETLYIDARTLALPPDTAAGTYQLALALYDRETLERLKAPSGEDLLMLETVELP